MHVWAEQLETVMANRIYKPTCKDLLHQQFYLMQKICTEYKFLIQDVHTFKQGGGWGMRYPPLK